MFLVPILGGGAFCGASMLGVPSIIITILLEVLLGDDAFNYVLFPIDKWIWDISIDDLNIITILALILCEASLIGIIVTMLIMLLFVNLEQLELSPKFGLSSAIIGCFFGILFGILFIDIESEILRSIIAGIIVVIIMCIVSVSLYFYLFKK